MHAQIHTQFFWSAVIVAVVASEHQMLEAAGLRPSESVLRVCVHVLIDVCALIGIAISVYVYTYVHTYMARGQRLDVALPSPILRSPVA
jgi:hypothetical protein